jgi:hypothetical protein
MLGGQTPTEVSEKRYHMRYLCAGHFKLISLLPPSQFLSWFFPFEAQVQV